MEALIHWLLQAHAKNRLYHGTSWPQVKSIYSEELLPAIHGAGQSPTTLARSTDAGFRHFIIEFSKQFV